MRFAAAAVGTVAALSAAGAAYFYYRAPTAADHWALVDGYPRAGEAAIKKLRAHLMPPPGEPRPPEAALNALVGWLERTLDEAADAAPNPGAPVLHRLNRAEDANAVRDLVDLPVG